VYDTKVVSFGNRLFQPDGDLIQFTFAGSVGGHTNQPAGLRVTGAGCEMKGFGEQIVTKEYAGFRVPAAMHSGHVASEVRVINDVVVDERCGVDHLDDRRKLGRLRDDFWAEDHRVLQRAVPERGETVSPETC
jgi:hypothetical protein